MNHMDWIGNMSAAVIPATSNTSARLAGPHQLAWKTVEKLKKKNAVCYNLNGIDLVQCPGVVDFRGTLRIWNERRHQ